MGGKKESSEKQVESKEKMRADREDEMRDKEKRKAKKMRKGEEGERQREGWKQRRAVCDIYCFSNWKGKLVLICSGANSVEKQEARGPAHPYGQLVPSDSCSPLPVSYIQWFPPSTRPPGNQTQLTTLQVVCMQANLQYRPYYKSIGFV